MEINHVPAHASPNCKIPTTEASAGKLRAPILKPHPDTHAFQLTKPKHPVLFSLPEDTAPGTNQVMAQSDDRVGLGTHEDFTRSPGSGLALVQENLECLASLECFRDKLEGWIGEVHRELFPELEIKDCRMVSSATATAESGASESSSSLVVNPGCSAFASVESYTTGLLRKQSSLTRFYSRSCFRGRNNDRPGAGSWTRRTMSQEPIPNIRSQPIGHGPCIPPTVSDAGRGVLDEMPFVYPDHRQCYGLERFDQMSSVFIQPSEGLFNFLNTLCPKFLFATRQDIFHHETLPPIFTITQTSNHWSDLKYLINHNDYSGGSVMTDLCFRVECEPFYDSCSLFHNAKFSLADSTNVQLGTSKFYSANPLSPVLFVQCDLTREAFLVRSRNYVPGYHDSDFFVKQVTEFEEGDPVSDETETRDNSHMAVISRRIPRTLTGGSSEVYPLQERLVISFCGKVHPYTKGTLIAASLVLKHDLFK